MNGGSVGATLSLTRPGWAENAESRIGACEQGLTLVRFSGSRRIRTGFRVLGSGVRVESGSVGVRSLHYSWT